MRDTKDEAAVEDPAARRSPELTIIGAGIPFFDRLDRDIALHLAEVKAYQSGMVELRYEVQARLVGPGSST